MAPRQSSPCKLLIVVLHAKSGTQAGRLCYLGLGYVPDAPPSTVHVVSHSTKLLSLTLSLVDFLDSSSPIRLGDTSRSALQSVLEMSKLQAQASRLCLVRSTKARARTVPTSAFSLLPSPFSLNNLCALAKLFRAMLRLGFNRKASWNWVIASSSCPFRARAAPRLAWASTKLGLILMAVSNWSIASRSCPF